MNNELRNWCKSHDPKPASKPEPCSMPEAHNAHMELNGECPWCGMAIGE